MDKKELENIKANTAKHWFKRYGLWILIGLALIIFIISRIIPSPKGKPEILKKAKEEAAKAKDAATKALEEHNKAMAERKAELENIKAMSDEEARLQALADFANKHLS